MDVIPIWVLFIVTIAVVMLAIEGGYRLGQRSHKKSEDEKESPVSAISATILGLLAFILAFTFGMTSDRYDARKALVREEAAAIRTAWLRSDFLPEPDRGEAAQMIINYVDLRVAAINSGDLTQLASALVESARIQTQLWDMAVVNARKDMNSDVAALYLESLNEMTNLNAERISVGLQARAPGISWVVLYSLIILGMFAVGYQTAIAGSTRTWSMFFLALSFSIVITLIAVLDRPQTGFVTVSQQPMENLQATMKADTARP